MRGLEWLGGRGIRSTMASQTVSKKAHDYIRGDGSRHQPLSATSPLKAFICSHVPRLDAPDLQYRHGRDFSAELDNARWVAKFALQTDSWSSKSVKDMGLPSAIACQVLRKYSRNPNIKAVRNVQLTIPGQAVKISADRQELYISRLKLRLDISHLLTFEKVNQIELDSEYAHVTVTINEPPVREVENWIGVDLNSTAHVAVVGNPSTGKVQKYRREAPHIH